MWATNREGLWFCGLWLEAMQCDQESQDSVLVQQLICSVALNKSLPSPGFQAAVLILVFHHQSGDNTPDLRSNASTSYRKHQASDMCAGETLQPGFLLPALCSYRQGLGCGLDHLILRSYSSRGFLLHPFSLQFMVPEF